MRTREQTVYSPWHVRKRLRELLDEAYDAGETAASMHWDERVEETRIDRRRHRENIDFMSDEVAAIIITARFGKNYEDQAPRLLAEVSEAWLEGYWDMWKALESKNREIEE